MRFSSTTVWLSRAVPALAFALIAGGLFSLSQPADAQRAWFRPVARAAAYSAGAVTYSCENGVCRPVASAPVVSRPAVFSRPYTNPRVVSYSAPAAYSSSFGSTGGYSGYSSYPVSSYSNVRYSFSSGSTGGSGVYAPATVYQAPVAACQCGPNCPCRTQSRTSVTPPAANSREGLYTLLPFTDGSYVKTIVNALQRDPYWIPSQDAEPGLKAAFAVLESALPHMQRGAFSAVGSLPDPTTGSTEAEVTDGKDLLTPPTSSGSSNGPTNRALQKALQWTLPSDLDGPRLASL